MCSFVNTKIINYAYPRVQKDHLPLPLNLMDRALQFVHSFSLREGIASNGTTGKCNSSLQPSIIFGLANEAEFVTSVHFDAAISHHGGYLLCPVTLRLCNARDCRINPGVA